MSGFRVFNSNRLEILAEQMAQVVDAEPLSSPLGSDVIVVQSKGMERWLSMTLAKRFGIWANCQYLFPNKIISQLMQSVIPDIRESHLFEPQILTLRILKSFSACLDKPGFESLRNYLHHQADPLKYLQLAERLAKIFNQYLVYRPDWILAWEEGKETIWQAELWRELVTGEEGGDHKAGIFKRFMENIPRPVGGVERISVFGIPSLPPVHLQIIAAVSAYLEVNFFLLNPCQEYWFDLVSEKEASKRQKKIGQKRGDGKIPSAQDLCFEIGHPILSFLGKQGVHFFKQLLDLPDLEDLQPQFEDPGQHTLLSCIQSDILNLQERDGRNIPKKIVAIDDTSVQIHVCHSPWREIEVLYDNLLAIFERMADLSPSDILVMTPDIELYAPYIAAVFGDAADPKKKIPYSLADRSARRKGQLIEVFLEILGLYGSRFSRTQVLDILDTPYISQQFGLEKEETRWYVRRWVEDTRICWGLDSHDRIRHGLPPFEENTWKMGLERLLLGYALPGKGDSMFAQILPYDDIEGIETKILGRLVGFISLLSDRVKALDRSRCLTDWATYLEEILSLFFKLDQSVEEEVRILQDIFNDLRASQEKAGVNDKFRIEVIRAYLTDHLGEKGLDSGFLTGAVTFCTMRPMRSIPFRVVALLGMNDTAFPRRDNVPGFDLMAKAPRLGDPSKREEDRYLFLETLLSARDLLYISYIGQSIKDNSSIPPSVVVSELIESINQGFEHSKSNKKIVDQLVVNHRLQAFSPAYFTRAEDEQIFSYSEENSQAINNRLKGIAKEKLFMATALSPPVDKWKTLKIEQLISFFSHPARFFLQARLGIRLNDLSSAEEEKEPFEIKGLQKYWLKQKLVQRLLKGEDIEALYPVIRAEGLLPIGYIGQASYQLICSEVSDLVKRIRQYAGEEELPDLEVDLTMGEFHLLGKINRIWPGGLLHYRCANVKPKDYLGLWIEHLILNCLLNPEYPTESLLISSDGQWRFSSLPESSPILEALLNIYWQGMRTPLFFFPDTSWEYAQKLFLKPEEEEKALLAANLRWEGNDFGLPGEIHDPIIQLCFGKIECPLNHDFRHLAKEILFPLLRCLCYRSPDK